MVDHPLIADDLRRYIQSNQIEETLNRGLNEVLAQLPQDPFSQMAAILIDSAQRSPTIESLKATEIPLNESMQTIKVDIMINYQGQVDKAFSYVVPQNQEDLDNAEYMFDDVEGKSGFSNACQIINNQLSTFFKGRELPLLKKTFDQLNNFVEKQKQNVQQMRSEEGTVPPTGDAGEHTKPVSRFSESQPNSGLINKYAVKCVLEALLFTYGHVISPELPVKSLYYTMQQKAMTLQTTNVPKMMFTVFNGGKAMGSKVKFSRFYIILNVKAQESVDVSDLYYKISMAVKKSVESHKLGINAFKANQSGAYFNALENVNETYKLLEDAINQTNFMITMSQINS